MPSGPGRESKGSHVKPPKINHLDLSWEEPTERADPVIVAEPDGVLPVGAEGAGFPAAPPGGRRREA
jgi:hypothetical protein